jgi:hypothetical protein
MLNNLSTKISGEGVSVCPGPNMAYYDKIMSLRDITDHIYGRKNLISRTDRPHIFVKELSLYSAHLQEKVEDLKVTLDKKQLRYISKFKNNLEEGIRYYNELFLAKKTSFVAHKEAILEALQKEQNKLNLISIEIEKI